MMLKGSKIFINEDLTVRKSKLAFDVRQHVKNNPGSNTWTNDGKIFYKPTPASKPRAILNITDLEDSDTNNEATSIINTTTD